VTNKGLESVVYEITRHLSHLENLNLNFSRCGKLNDEGLNNLAGEISKHLPHLQQLALNFSEYK